MVECENERKQLDAIAAAGRLFRAYEDHCISPGVDTLFNTLTCMHSLNDKLRNAVDQDFHSIDEFIALKALRNFAHHQEEVRANVRVIPTPATSDLAFLCIVRRDQVERAIANVDKRWRQNTDAACRANFHWYDQAVNINPCLFNFMVLAYELLTKLDLLPPKEAIESFEHGYRSEEERDLSHLVDGRLFAHAGDVSEVLSVVVGDLPKP